MDNSKSSVQYTNAGDEYFAKRGLRKYAGVWSLWALGIGAVISGHYSGWNLGLASGGWGGMFVATIIIAIMYIGLTFSIAEMSFKVTLVVTLAALAALAVLPFAVWERSEHDREVMDHELLHSFEQC